VATVAIGIVGTVAVWLVGADLVPLVFSDAFGIERGVITLIAASGAVFMVAQVAAQALLALGAERIVVVGWSVGLVILVLTLAWQGPIAERAALALLTGSVGAFVVLALGTLVTYRRWITGGSGVPAPV